jgi:hypothetical protein
MVARQERDHLDLLRVEPAQIPVLDQIVRVTVMSLIADVYADVMQQRAVLEPLALFVGQSVDAPRLIEDGEREPCDLLCMLRPVAAALAELDDAPAPDVWIALDLANPRAVPVDIVEDQAFAKGKIAEREFLGSEPAKDRIEQNRACDRQVRASRIHPR